MYPRGTTVKINMGNYDHYGIYDGFGGVIHNSKRTSRVVYEDIDTFSGGRQVELSNIKGSCLEKAYQKAISLIGQKYNLLISNCEHFVRECHGVRLSKQVEKKVLMTLSLGTILVAKKPLVKFLGLIGLILSYKIDTDICKQPQ